MKSLNLILFAILFAFRVESQENYKFIVENPVRYEFDSLLTVYEGIMFEFSGERVWLSENVFYEKNPISRDIDTFMIVNGGKKWLVKHNGAWELFYSRFLFNRGKTTQFKKLDLKPFNKERLEDHELYMFDVYIGEGYNRFHSKLLFDEKIGFVKIVYLDFSLLRIWL